MNAGIRLSWGKIIAGREKLALELFQDSVTYFGKKMADGRITSFDPFLLSTGDQTEENGFFVVKAPLPEVFAMMDEEAFKELMTRAHSLLDHFRFDLLVTGEELAKQLTRFEKSLAMYP